MCGIAGLISFDGNVNSELIGVMLDTMVHRGPDDSGVYADISSTLSVYLGQCRLSILDLSSAGHQPMPNEDKSIWIVFNGEIYNFLELKEQLLTQGHQFSSNTDTEVIVHLYEEYGLECVNLLRGMFAFAIWDKKLRRVFIARDRLGKKPLYYAQTHKGLYFSSEIQALYPIQDIARNLDLIALDHYFAHSYIPSPLSIYKEIRKLPPATTMLVENGNVKISKYWSLDYTPKLDISFSEAKDHLFALLEEAVRIRLCSDVPLGCFLSGGTDSSTVVALMSRLSVTPVKTFSIGFAEKKYDETHYARIVASHYKTEHHEFRVEPSSIDILPDLVRHFGEPFADSSALPTLYLSSMTRKYVTVALNGDGGDESFGGYNWYQTASFLSSISAYCPKVLAKILCRHVPRGSASRKVRRVFELLALNNATRFCNLRTEMHRPLRHSMYSIDMLMQIDAAVDSYLSSLFEMCSGAELLDKMLYTDVMSYLPEELLVKVDRATMAYSLEARSPLLDHKLMEFVGRLPSSFKIHNGCKKHILQDTVAHLFPDGFLERPKMGFSVPLQAWFRGELKLYIRQRLLDGKLATCGLFNARFLHQVANDQVPGVRDTGWLIWRLLILAEWMEINT